MSRITAKIEVLNAVPFIRITDPTEKYLSLIIDLKAGRATGSIPSLFKEMEGPTFTVRETARIFFARTAWWFRYHERLGHFQLDGESVVFERTDTVRNKGGKGDRKLYLADIEWIANALFEKGNLSESQFILSLQIALMVAQQYRMIV